MTARKAAATQLERAIEWHFDRLVLATDFPGVRTTEPVVWNFVLPAVLNGLLEHTVFVAEAITHRRNFHRSHRIEKTGRQAPEPSIAQASVGLLLQQLVPIELLFLNGLFGNLVEKKVRDIVSQRTTDEKFHREIVNALGVLAVIGLLGPNPSLRKDITHGTSDGFKTLAIADLRRFHNVIKDEVALIKSVVRSGELEPARSRIAQ